MYTVAIFGLLMVLNSLVDVLGSPRRPQSVEFRLVTPPSLTPTSI
jgi:hypothetical protein